MSAKTDNKLLWKFIYKTFLLVLLPTLLFLAAYEIAYRNIPNSYSLKKEYLDRCRQYRSPYIGQFTLILWHQS